MQICINKARHRKTSNRCRNAYVDAALPQCVPQRLRSTCLCAGSTRRASHISSAFYRMVFSFRLFLLFFCIFNQWLQTPLICFDNSFIRLNNMHSVLSVCNVSLTSQNTWWTRRLFTIMGKFKSNKRLFEIYNWNSRKN